MSDLVHVGLPGGESVLADFLDAAGHREQAPQLRGVEPVLYLWLLTQTDVDGYDTYDSCVVVAETPGAAAYIHPSPFATGFDEHHGRWLDTHGQPRDYGDWASHPDHITATKIGVAIGRMAGEVVCASFNAG